VGDDGYRETRMEMERVIRRLNALELLILVAAVFFALGGGALVAFLLSSGTELPFRPTWAVISLLLFVVPGVAVFGRERRTGRKGRPESNDQPSDGE
jgi:predicted lysophospholipase L1 biosynthesis ABC-type transport system permease subunit